MTRNDELAARQSTVDASADVRLDVDGVTEPGLYACHAYARRTAAAMIRKGLAREVVLWRAWPGGPQGRELLGVYRP